MNNRFAQGISLTILFLLMTSCTRSYRSQIPATPLRELKAQIRYLATDPNLQNSLVGIYIESLKNGTILFHQNEHRLFVPASNMKLFTSATALMKLGPQYQYRTTIWSNGAVKTHVLQGDLIIRGSGDPTISGRFYHGNRLSVFQSWADSLKKRGITTVSGDLIGDNSFFSGSGLGEGWSWNDEPFWYSAQTSALAFNDNCVDFTVIPAARAGAPVQLLMKPSFADVVFDNKAVTKDDSTGTFDYTRERAANRIRFYGTLPLTSDTLQESVSVEKPAQYFLQTLYKVLKDKGIAVQGKIKVVKQTGSIDYSKVRPLFEHRSVTLAKIIHTLNKMSHNFYAEQILKTLGAIYKHDGSFAGGAKVVRLWLQSIGISPDEFINVDGSGLSRKDFVAPMATATLLAYMYHQPQFPAFYSSLPVAGVDGTLRSRMTGTSAQGNVHAKTGYVKHMRSLAGYVYDQQKNPYLFVIMINNYSVPTPYVNRFQDRICILLSNFNPSR